MKLSTTETSLGQLKPNLHIPPHPSCHPPPSPATRYSTTQPPHHNQPPGTVHAMVRGHVFLKLADAPDKSLGGFVCVKSRSCATRAGAAAAAAAAAGGPQQPQQPDRGQQPGGFSGRGGGMGGGGFGGGRGRGRAAGGLTGIELRVNGGPYSGYKGRVLQVKGFFMLGGACCF
jgi:hypothetical protein